MQPGVFPVYSSRCLLFLFACYGIGNGENPELEIKWMDSGSTGWFYEGEDFDQGVGFEDDDIIVQSSVSTMFITCSASYPVQWIIDVPGIPDPKDSLAVNTQMHRVTDDYQNPLSYSFHAYLSLTARYHDIVGETITGNYTCASALDESALQTNRYIFWEAPTQSLVYGEVSNFPRKCTTPSCNNRASKTVKADKDNQTIIIPCSVFSPNTEVTLLKRYGSKVSDYEEIKIRNDSLQFDPKFGFILKVQELPSPYGIYKCEPKVKIGNESLIVNVTTGVATVWNTENNLETKNTKYYFENSTKSIICCAEGFKRPQIYETGCQTKFDCESMKLRLRYFQYLNRADSTTPSVNCRSSKIRENSGVFRCFGNGIDVTRTYLYIPEHVAHSSIRIPLVSDFHLQIQTPSTFESHARRNQSSIYIGKEIEDIPPEELLAISTSRGTVTDSTLKAIYSNTTKTILHCHGSKFLFSDGVQWSIVWKNLTKSVVKGSGLVSSGVNFDQELNKLEINITDDMAALICHAPLLDSWEWVNKTLNINMTEATLPLIKGPDVERLTWILGDTNKNIECEADGNPTPKFSWTMAWSSQPTSFSFLNTVRYHHLDRFGDGYGISITRFVRVIQAMNGKYECEASNELGTVKKTFFITTLAHNYQEPPAPSPAKVSTNAARTTKTTQNVKPTEMAQLFLQKFTTSSPKVMNAGSDGTVPNSNTSVGLLVAFGFLAVGLLAGGIVMIVFFLKYRKQQMHLESLQKVSYRELEKINPGMSDGEGDE